MKPSALLTTVPSDSHMWNLIFMQLFLEEQGFEVVNLGPCSPFEMLEDAIVARPHELVVVSTVNGHGYFDGIELSRRLASLPGRAAMRLVLGGKLGVRLAQEAAQAEVLRRAGFDAVFYGPAALDEFSTFLDRIRRRAPIAANAS